MSFKSSQSKNPEYDEDDVLNDSLGSAGYTKKEFTQDDNQLTLGTGAKKKHFLDEDPIPPDYMMASMTREHRSLDRNFERQSEYDSVQKGQKAPAERMHRSYRKAKQTSYALSRFLQSEAMPPGSAWSSTRPADNLFLYSSMPSKFPAEESLEPKVECMYSLLSMLGSNDSVETSKKFLDLSQSADTCASLYRSGCIPLLVQMRYSDPDEEVQRRAAMALHNVVHNNPDGHREAKVLRLIEQIMDYCSFLKTLLQSGGEAIADDSDRHPLAAISSLMKVSFDEEKRNAMCQFGALQAIAALVHLDHAAHGARREDQCCNSLRRYALMALTNLTFGDGNNKALLCANKDFMESLVAQLYSAPDDLLQVTASVLRNLSWQADNKMKNMLNEIGTVTALARTAMNNKNENTLKAILSALWNLSAHCSTNKAEFCSVEGSLAFLVEMVTYEGPSKTLKIIENAGGILRNVSSHIAVREDYRKILRERNCLLILLQQLKSESLTVVSNACGTLWNLSARCPEDQKFLWDNGAVPMLRSLIHSKHKLISEGSSAALKNLLNCRPGASCQKNMDPIAKGMGLKELPSLNARKKKALEDEIDQNLSETCDNLDTVSPHKEKKDYPLNSFDFSKHEKINRLTQSASVSKSESRDSVLSVKSDSCCDRTHRPMRIYTNRSEPKEKTKFTPLPPTDSDLEPDCEQPFDYSVQFKETGNRTKLPNDDAAAKEKAIKLSAYQETDLDQPTDFSLRYAENQVESDFEGKPQATNALVLEDSIKCYQTEDTPYVISNAASITDLRNPKTEEKKEKTEGKCVTYGSGTYTPEKPINYCEEGTPGYFSRYDSLSSLDETVQRTSDQKASQEDEEETKTNDVAKPQGNSAQETPLMFSRRSSMDSLVEEQVTADDKSSVVSDFSRLASGVISPSDIPDSPTQSISHSPRRSSPPSLPKNVPQQPLRSVFEDNYNEFHVENTPAQFSCATSLSNLSLDDEHNSFLNSSVPKEEADVQIEEKTESEEEEVNDDFLLAECINIGMKRPVTKAPIVPTDSIKQYCTEGTPAISKVPSISNLSNVSVGSNAGEMLNLSDVSSNESDGCAEILEQCIRDGMKKPPAIQANVPSETASKRDPIEMLRRGGLPPYLPIKDELNKFLVEDSPCTFSVVSGLSNLSINSSLPPAREQSIPSAIPKDVVELSSSIDSSDDDNQSKSLLEECIRMGMNKRPPLTPSADCISGGIGRNHKRSTDRSRKANLEENHVADLSSSVDSSDNDSHSKSLLEECIRMGMNKRTARPQPAVSHSSPKRYPLPNTFRTPDRERQHKNDALNDALLLKECINAGMGRRPDAAGGYDTQSIPKNGSTTLAGVLEPIQHQTTSSSSAPSTAPGVETTATTNGTKTEPASPATTRTNDPAKDLQTSTSPQRPATTGSEPLQDKHKNPDLMLQSVDRLTYNFVSTAEFLRSGHESFQFETGRDVLCHTSSDNTWNEDSNDVSFPSLSVTAPVIASFNDDDDLTSTTSEAVVGATLLVEDIYNFAITPTNEIQPFDTFNTGEEQPASLEPESLTVICSNPELPPINFQVGGEVQERHFKKASIDNLWSGNICSLSGSSSSLDLDNIGPPSGMDSLTNSGFYDFPHSPQLSTFRKKFLPSGMMARRALGNLSTCVNGSLDSVTSCNLDNIKTPSLMDELLDSMISVESIQSEVGAHTFYESAISQHDDTTTLMQSCLDNLSNDDDSLTHVMTDMSSAESTPRKSNLLLTPKDKRRLASDRYKTYTIIDSDIIAQLKSNETKDEIMTLEVNDDFAAKTTSFEVPSTQPQNDLESLTSNEEDFDDMSSIGRLTKQFKYITPPEPTAEIEPEPAEVVEKVETPKKGPIIVKPPDKDSGTDVNYSEESLTNMEEEVKVVRGRAKPAYVSPYRKSALPALAKPKPAPARVQKRVQKVEKKATAPVLERQGTFVKDEPSIEKLPVVDSQPAKKPSKIAMFSRTPEKQPLTAVRKAIGKSRVPVPPPSRVPQRSNSNASIRTTISMAVVKPKQSLTTPPSRSNSNLTSKKISNIGSKIAGIWKTNLEKRPASSTSTQAAARPQTAGQASKLIRSSTFDQAKVATKRQLVTPKKA